MKGNRTWILPLIVGIAAILVGFALGWIINASLGPKLTIIEGTTTAVSEAGDAIGLEIQPGSQGQSFQIEGAWWRVQAGTWNTHGPTCLAPLSAGQKVRLGVIDLSGTESPRGDVVIWLECLK